MTIELTRDELIKVVAALEHASDMRTCPEDYLQLAIRLNRTLFSPETLATQNAANLLAATEKAMQ